jgi:hypothetical protein
MATIVLCLFYLLVLLLTTSTYNNNNNNNASSRPIMKTVNAFAPMTYYSSSLNSSRRADYFGSIIRKSSSSINAAARSFLELKATKPNQENNSNADDGSIINSRRSFLSSIIATTATTTTTAVVSITAITGASPAPAYGRYILDEETGDYIEQIADSNNKDDDVDWKVEWKSRYKQMSTMSKDEIFQAGRGAGNIDKKDLINESSKSRKRRALSNCRNKTILKTKFPTMDEKTCIQRILDNGDNDINFILN